MSRRIGFIGLGTMGAPMAENLLKKNGQLLVADVVPEKKEAFAAKGAQVAEGNREIFESCEIAFLSLPTTLAVEAVVFGGGGLLDSGREGLIVLNTSTVGYALNRRAVEEAEKKGIIYIDCAVSGGAGRAKDGTLSLMVGASREELLQRDLWQYLEAIGTHINCAGTRGGGAALKIINNMLSKSILFADAEAIVLAEQLGISFDSLYDMIQSSSSQNEILRIKKEHIRDHRYDPSGKSYAPLTMVLKDMGFARELVDEAGVVNFGCDDMLEWYRMAVRQGYAQMDSSFLVEMVRKIQEPAAARTE